MAQHLLRQLLLQLSIYHWSIVWRQLDKNDPTMYWKIVLPELRDKLSAVTFLSCPYWNAEGR